MVKRVDDERRVADRCTSQQLARQRGRDESARGRGGRCSRSSSMRSKLRAPRRHLAEPGGRGAAPIAAAPARRVDQLAQHQLRDRRPAPPAPAPASRCAPARRRPGCTVACSFQVGALAEVLAAPEPKADREHDVGAAGERLLPRRRARRADGPPAWRPAPARRAVDRESACSSASSRSSAAASDQNTPSPAAISGRSAPRSSVERPLDRAPDRPARAAPSGRRRRAAPLLGRRRPGGRGCWSGSRPAPRPAAALRASRKACRRSNSIVDQSSTRFAYLENERQISTP